MQTENYALTDVAELTLPEDRCLSDEDRQRQKLLKATGMKDRLSFEQESVESTDKLWLATQAYPELVGRTRRLWRAFLPTVRRIDEYRYDAVPVEALEAIQTAQRLGCFTRIVIWTPEGNSFKAAVLRKFGMVRDRMAALFDSLDPMAVGIVVGPGGEKHFFQIARWGEALLPMSKIKSHVWRLQARLFLLFVVLPVLLFSIACVSYYMLIEHFGYGPVLGVTGAAVFALMFIFGDIIFDTW